jgi:hypothetical protein
MSGCAVLESVGGGGDEPADPNDVQVASDVLTAVGDATAAVGTATSNPAAVGIGVLITTIGGAILASKKKET